MPWRPVEQVLVAHVPAALIAARVVPAGQPVG
jgi:hypothetical protein